VECILCQKIKKYIYIYIYEEKKDQGLSSVVEYLPSTHEDLGSVPNIKEKIKRGGKEREKTLSYKKFQSILPLSAGNVPKLLVEYLNNAV
jgi:hypothetical protein